MALADFKKALNSASEIEITTIGRTSGREISNPVWFVDQGDKLYLLPVDGSESQWYKNLLKNPTIRPAADEARYDAKATPVTDPARVSAVVAAFREPY
jgi:deazaflavin-dependent oxidoreductase (nitroreductase family)